MPTLRVPIWKTNAKFIPANDRGPVDDPKFLHSLARQFYFLRQALRGKKNEQA